MDPFGTFFMFIFLMVIEVVPLALIYYFRKPFMEVKAQRVVLERR